MADNSFSIDVAKIRERARQKMADGPVTSGYRRSPDEVVGVLNDVLATEIVCWMRYSRHAISATGIDRAQVAAEFTEHADEEGGQHGALRQDLAGQRVQLGVAEGLHVVPFLPCHARISRWSPDVPFSPQVEAR